MKSLSLLHPCGKESTGPDASPKYFSGTLAVSLLRAGFPIKEGIKQRLHQNTAPCTTIAYFKLIFWEDAREELMIGQV